MRKFKEILNEEQLHEFLDDNWNFHDSVISEIKYKSGSKGSCEGTYPIDDRRELIIKFEGIRYKDKFFNALELKFERVLKAFIAPNNENYTTNIMCANIVLKEKKFIFVNDISLSIDNILTDEIFYYYISAEKLYFRYLNYKK